MLIDIDCITFDNKGNEVGTMKVSNVNIIEQSNYNLFSLTKLLRNGWTMHGNPERIEMKKDTETVTFDIKIEMSNGALNCAHLNRKEVAPAASNIAGRGAMSIDKAHWLLGHRSEKTTRATAANLNWVIKKGKMATCEACAITKAKHKNTNKDASAPKATKTNER